MIMKEKYMNIQIYIQVYMHSKFDERGADVFSLSPLSIAYTHSSVIIFIFGCNTYEMHKFVLFRYSFFIIMHDGINICINRNTYVRPDTRKKVYQVRLGNLYFITCIS